MTDREFITPLQGFLTCKSAAIALRTASAASCKLPPTAHECLINDINAAGEYFGEIERRRQKREAEAGR